MACVKDLSFSADQFRLSLSPANVLPIMKYPVEHIITLSFRAPGIPIRRDVPCDNVFVL